MLVMATPSFKEADDSEFEGPRFEKFPNKVRDVLCILATESTLKLTWTPNKTGAPTLKYKVELEEDGELKVLAENLKYMTYEVKDLQPGRCYTFRVYAGNQHGYEPFGHVCTFQTSGGKMGVELVPTAFRIRAATEGTLMRPKNTMALGKKVSIDETSLQKYKIKHAQSWDVGLNMISEDSTSLKEDAQLGNLSTALNQSLDNFPRVRSSSSPNSMKGRPPNMKLPTLPPVTNSSTNTPLFSTSPARKPELMPTIPHSPATEEPLKGAATLLSEA
eukprot:Colp12_sorted_trinity150504_noHs@2700